MGLTPIRPNLPPDDPAFAAIKALVIARTGHDYYRDKDAQLREKIADRMAACGIGEAQAYLARLKDAAAGPAEWRALESAITINETFFFRFAEQFAALRRTILPGLIAANRETRRLRIWSVGCSTGAEPYSIAILIDQLLGERLADWRVTITGTDIDEEALATARSALFGPWALRTLGEAERDRFFTRERDRFRLLPRYRSHVRFERHNLMSLADGSAPLGYSDYDLILCRNVLIYFDLRVAMRVVAGLVERLGPAGWLLVGHAEPSPAFDAVAAGHEVDGVLAYRRRGEGGIVPPVPVPIPVPLPSTFAPPPVRAKRSRGAGQAMPPLAARPSTTLRTNGVGFEREELEPDAADLDPIRQALANGDGAEAARLAEGEMARRPRDPVPHYLAALGAMALGAAAEAERGFRRALYLDSGFAMAHYLLGRQLLAIGRTEDGRRALANAARSVSGAEEDAVVPEGDGMTAGGLIAAVRSELAAVRG